MGKNTNSPDKPARIKNAFSPDPALNPKRGCKNFFILFLWLAASFFLLNGPAYPEQKSSEQLIAQIDFSSWVPATLAISPDNTRVAYVAQAGKKQFLVVDGKPGKPYDRIANFTFSPDSARVAFVAQEALKQLVVVDGKEEKKYDGIFNGAVPAGRVGKKTPYIFAPVFSPDSAHLAYAAQTNGKQCMVVDGEEGKYYDRVYFPFFSPDSTHLAYVAQTGGKEFVVADEKEEKHYDHILKDDVISGPQNRRTSLPHPVFSPDSARMVYGAQTGDKWFVIVDGKAGKRYDRIIPGTLSFSPDSQQAAYAAGSYMKEFLVIDGKEEKHYDHIINLLFSPDSTRIAYAVKEDLVEHFVVVDRKEGKSYEDIGTGTPVFSPDSARVAYVAQAECEEFVVVDGKKGKPYDKIGANTLSFSPDSKRVAWTAKEGDQWLVFADEPDGNLYDVIYAPVFSPDSAKIAYAAKADGKEFVVVDGEEGKPYDELLKGGKIIFDFPDSLHYLARRDNSIYLVKEEIH